MKVFQLCCENFIELMMHLVEFIESRHFMEQAMTTIEERVFHIVDDHQLSQHFPEGRKVGESLLDVHRGEAVQNCGIDQKFVHEQVLQELGEDHIPILSLPRPSCSLVDLVLFEVGRPVHVSGQEKQETDDHCDAMNGEFTIEHETAFILDVSGPEHATQLQADPDHQKQGPTGHGSMRFAFLFIAFVLDLPNLVESFQNNHVCGNEYTINNQRPALIPSELCFDLKYRLLH